MLRRVRDKLYQGGAGLPPLGRTVRRPSLSPPARGAAPFLLNDLRSFSQGFCVFRGATPQTPRCGLRPQIELGFLCCGYDEMIMVDKGCRT